MNHVRLTGLDENHARREIQDCKAQLEDILGKPCSIFCFPGGNYRSVHLPMLRDAGFSAARTVELLSFQRPQIKGGISLIPTTIQAYPHGAGAYFRNALKRRSRGALQNLLLGCRAGDWPQLVRLSLERAERLGGVFHLWGHSWEIENTVQWAALDQAMAIVSQYAQRASVVTNGELCNHGRTSKLAPELAVLSR